MEPKTLELELTEMVIKRGWEFCHDEQGHTCVLSSTFYDPLKAYEEVTRLAMEVAGTYRSYGFEDSVSTILAIFKEGRDSEVAHLIPDPELAERGSKIVIESNFRYFGVEPQGGRYPRSRVLSVFGAGPKHKMSPQDRETLDRNLSTLGSDPNNPNDEVTTKLFEEAQSKLAEWQKKTGKELAFNHTSDGPLFLGFKARPTQVAVKTLNKVLVDQPVKYPDFTKDDPLIIDKSRRTNYLKSSEYELPKNPYPVSSFNI